MQGVGKRGRGGHCVELLLHLRMNWLLGDHGGTSAGERICFEEGGSGLVKRRGLEGWETGVGGWDVGDRGWETGVGGGGEKIGGEGGTRMWWGLTGWEGGGLGG